MDFEADHFLYIPQQLLHIEFVLYRPVFFLCYREHCIISHMTHPKAFWGYDQGSAVDDALRCWWDGIQVLLPLRVRDGWLEQDNVVSKIKAMKCFGSVSAWLTRVGNYTWFGLFGCSIHQVVEQVKKKVQEQSQQ